MADAERCSGTCCTVSAPSEVVHPRSQYSDAMACTACHGHLGCVQPLLLWLALFG